VGIVFIYPVISVQVVFPDGRLLSFPAKLPELRMTTANEAILDTNVILSHGVWSGKGMVRCR